MGKKVKVFYLRLGFEKLLYKLLFILEYYVKLKRKEIIF